MQIRPEYQITAQQLHDGAAVRFRKDPALITSLKARFPRARWGSGTRSWHIPGKLAYRRVTVWVAEQQAYLAGLEGAARDAEWEGATAANLGRRAIANMRPYKSIGLEMIGDTIVMRTAYHPRLVALFRGLGGKWVREDWRAGRWEFPVAAGAEIAARRDEIADLHNETIRGRTNGQASPSA